MNSCLSLWAKNPVPGEVAVRLTLRFSPGKAAKLSEAFLMVWLTISPQQDVMRKLSAFFLPVPKRFFLFRTFVRLAILYSEER